LGTLGGAIDVHGVDEGGGEDGGSDDDDDDERKVGEPLVGGCGRERTASGPVAALKRASAPDDNARLTVQYPSLST
jgi:hypothetical protein